MFGWIVRLLMLLAGLITALFVERNALNFSIIQMIISVLLFTLVVALITFWPFFWRWWQGRK